MMNKKVHSPYSRFIVVIGFTLLISLLTLMFVTVSIGYAQDDTVTGADETQANVATFTFSDLDQPAIDLIPPAQSTVSFRLPYRWQLIGGDNYIEMHFDVYKTEFLPITGAESVDDVLLSVYVDNKLVTSFVPSPGLGQVVQIPFPIDVNPYSRTHEIRFVLQGKPCVVNYQTRVVIHDTSKINLEYETRPLSPNLANFPRPLIQEQLSPESLLIILPDAYREADLSAAAAVAAAIGGESPNTVAISVTTPVELKPEQLANQSIVAIGQPAQNAFIAGLYEREVLPTTLADVNTIVDVDAQPIAPDDGVLQEIISEANPDHVYLIVSGSSDEAVNKAARALSADDPDFGLRGDVAVIKHVQEVSPIEETLQSEIITLTDIGFQDVTWSGIGQHNTSRSFSIPADWEVQEQASLTFSYIPSTMLDPTQSSLRIELNGRVIGDAPLTSGLTGEQQQTILLPIHDLHPGSSNRLSFVADLATDDLCPSLDTPQVWLRLPSDGYISLPHEVNPDFEPLIERVEPFLAQPDLSDILFVLPDDPSEADLYVLVQLAQMMGDMTDGGVFTPEVQFASTVDIESISPKQIVALGRPSSNGLITAFNEQLPQPFLPEEDSLGQTESDLSYRLPPDFSLGVIQYLPAPWDPQRPFVVVSGTTDEGLMWAVDALISDGLDGNLTFVRDGFVESFELLAPKQLVDLEANSTAIANMVEVVESATLTPEPQVTIAPEAPESEPVLSKDSLPNGPDKYQPPPPASIIPMDMIKILIGAGLFLLVVGALITWFRSWRKRRNAA